MADLPDIKGQMAKQMAQKSAAELSGQQGLRQASEIVQRENARKEFAEGIGISDESLHQMEEGIKKEAERIGKGMAPMGQIEKSATTGKPQGQAAGVEVAGSGQEAVGTGGGEESTRERQQQIGKKVDAQGVPIEQPRLQKGRRKEEEKPGKVSSTAKKAAGGWAKAALPVALPLGSGLVGGLISYLIA